MFSEKDSLESDIRLAMRFSHAFKIARALAGGAVIGSYFFYPEVLLGALTVAVVLLVFFPLGFFDVFIQKLLEYNTSLLEERASLNAREANEALSDFEERIRMLEEQ